jgi:putative membrane protein
MKGQKLLIFALIFALIIAIFSVVNVEPVPVNFLFGQASIPLIIVIIASTLIGGLIVGAVGIFRQYSLQKEVKLLRKTVENQLGQEALQNVEQNLNSEQPEQTETTIMDEKETDIDENDTRLK